MQTDSAFRHASLNNLFEDMALVSQLKPLEYVDFLKFDKLIIDELHPDSMGLNKAPGSSLFAGMCRSISKEISATRRPNNNEDDNDT